MDWDGLRLLSRDSPSAELSQGSHVRQGLEDVILERILHDMIRIRVRDTRGLLVTQRHHRVHANRAPGGDVACKQGRASQQK